MLPVSQDCLLLITPSVFSNVYLPCVLCTQCCQCLRIVYYWLHLRFSLTFICPVYCVHNVASFSGLSIVVTPSVFSNVYLPCVLCTQCCQCLRIVYYWLHLRFSLTFICPTQCCQCLDCLLLITPSVFSNVYLPYVLCTQCCQCLRIVYYWLHLRFSLTFISPVSCVPNVVSVSGLSIIDYTFGFL